MTNILGPGDQGCTQLVILTMCDNQGSFLRKITNDCSGQYLSHTDTTLDGTTPYLPVGAISNCQPDTAADVDYLILCDDNGSFIRQFEDGMATNTMMDGLTPYVPVGAVGACGIDYEQVCYRLAPQPCGTVVEDLLIPPEVIPPFDNVTVFANPNGYSVTSLQNSRNFNTAGNNWGRINTGGGNAVGVVLEYTYNTPVDNPGRIRIDSGGGANLGDCDGVLSATATLLNSADTVLWTGPIVAGNTGAARYTSIPSGLLGVSKVQLSNITKCRGAPNIHIRSFRLVAEYTIGYVYDCANLSIVARGDLAAVTITPTTITQTTTPHSLRFSVPGSSNWQATITTDQPGRFSRLTVDQNSPVVDFTGTGVAQFEIAAIDLTTPAAAIRVGTMQFDGTTRTLHDTLTGAEITGQQIVPCCCNDDIVPSEDPIDPDDGNTSGTATETIVCANGVSLIRRVFNDVVSFVGTDGATVVNPPTWTVGPCGAAAGGTNGATEIMVCAAGVQLIRRTDNAGVITYVGTNGAAVATPPAFTIGACPVVPTNRLIQTYRLAGNVVGTATPSTVPGDNPTVGNTVTIAAGFRSIAWEWLRETVQSNSAAAQLTVNGLIYIPGSGQQYQTNGKRISFGDNEVSLNAYQFTAVGLAFVEITVIR